MAYTRDHVLTLDDFAKLPSNLVWAAIDAAYNAGTNPFADAGVLTSNPLITAGLTDGNNIRTEVEAWNDIAYVESNISNDDPTQHAVPMKMDSKVWGAVRMHRNVGISGMNLVQDFTAVDPLAALSSRIANYKNTDAVTALFAVLNGLIKGDATAKHFTHQMDGGFDITQVLKAVQAAKGDNSGVITTLGMNSANYLALQLANLVDTVQASDSNTSFKAVADRRLVVDDRFGANVIGMGPALFATGAAPQARKSVAVESDESAGNGSGQDTIWFRWKNIVHPMGFDYEGTFAAKGGPSYTELNTAGAYVAATDVKKIPLVVITPAA